MMGHLIAAAGSVEAITCLLAIREKLLPPTTNYAEPDPECDLNYVPNQSVEHTTEIALCNCIGFGSKNSALVVARGEAA